MAATDQTANPALSLVPTDEERMLRETVRKICADFGPEYSRRKTAAGEPPTELWDALASRGYLSVNLPEEYGGGGLGMSALAAVGEEITASGCSLLLIVVSPAIVGSILVRHGNEEQKDVWLRGIAAGTTKVAFAITEPGAGSNSHNLSTSARRSNGGYMIRGEKTFISAVEDSDAILVVTRARDDDGNLGLPLLFIVDSDAPGLEKQHIPTALRAPDKQWTLFFDDVEVPADRLIGAETGGLKAAFDGLNPERIMGAAVACGAGRRALDLASEYARERVVWQGPDRRAPGHLAPARAGEDRARAGAADDAEGRRAVRRRARRPARPATWRSTRPPRPRSSASTRRSRRTAATASRSSTAWPTCGGACGSCAPRRCRAR